jgi:hypothetical protein
MGVLTDYFRAPQVSLVQQRMVDTGGGPLVTAQSETSVFDGVELKSIDHAVVLAQLVGFATGRDWNIDGRLIWPAGTEHDVEHEGPWVVVLDDGTRDVLADIPSGRVPELADRWAGIEEFGGLADPGDLREAISGLSALAARARDAGESLFCWISL